MEPFYKSFVMRKPDFGVSDQVRQPQKIVRGLKFRGLYCLCLENKGADQLCDYCKADLHLWFCKCKKQDRSYDNLYFESWEQNKLTCI